MLATAGTARQGYEELRREALENRRGGFGLALMLRKGLAAWLQSWTHYAPPCAAAPGPTSAAFPPPQRDEVVLILAAMALGRLQEAV